MSEYIVSFIHPISLELAVITIADGGDNIATYLPIFAMCTNTYEVLLILLVNFTMSIISLNGAYFIVNKIPSVQSILVKYCSKIVPLLMISIGIYILSGSILATAINN